MCKLAAFELQYGLAIYRAIDLGVVSNMVICECPLSLV